MRTLRRTLLMRRTNCTTRMLLRACSSVVGCRRRTRVCAIFHKFAELSQAPAADRRSRAVSRRRRRSCALSESPRRLSGLRQVAFTQPAKHPWTRLALGVRTLVNWRTRTQFFVLQVLVTQLRSSPWSRPLIAVTPAASGGPPKRIFWEASAQTWRRSRPSFMTPRRGSYWPTATTVSRVAF
jgi:hypothetical protein